MIYGWLMDHGEPLLVFAASVLLHRRDHGAGRLVGERRFKRPALAE